MDRRSNIHCLFGVPRALIGVIQPDALPPTRPGMVGETAELAAAQARLYEAAGFHGLLIDQTHPTLCFKGPVGPEIVAATAVIGAAVRRATELPLGVKMRAGNNRAAIAVALASGGTFVRVEGFIFTPIADDGLVESSAGRLMEYRKSLHAVGLCIFADIETQHSARAITANMDLPETARAAEFYRADGVVVSGVDSGQPPDLADVRAVSDRVGIPVLVGSGVTLENVDRFACADGLFVGSSVKEDGQWSNMVDEVRARALVRRFTARGGRGRSA